MVTWIGICVGEVWKYLEGTQGGCHMKDLFKGIKAPRMSIIMAVGWLAREGHILLRGNPSNYKIKLNAKSK